MNYDIYNDGPYGEPWAEVRYEVLRSWRCWNVSYLPAGSGGDCVGGRSSCQGGCSYGRGWRTGQGTVLASSRSRDLKISDKLTSVLHKGIFKRLFYPLTLTKLIIRGLWGCSFIIKILNLLRDFWELRWHQQTSYLVDVGSYRIQIDDKEEI